MVNADQADLTYPDETKSFFNRTEDEFGPPEALVANAEVWPEEETPIKGMSLENTITTDQT